MTQAKKKDLSQMSVEELQAELEQRKKEKETRERKERRQFENDRDFFVSDTVGAFEKYHKELKAMKEFALEMGQDLYKRMFELKGRNPRDVKEFTLTNSDQTKKVVISMPPRLALTEESKVAIEGIKDVFRKKYASRAKQLFEVLEIIISKSNKNDYDPVQLFKLKRMISKMNDPELEKNYKMLEESQVVVGTAMYVRAYKKDERGKWQDIVLQFSAL